MTSYPLTAQGAADKMKDLYALSDADLATQATTIAADFKEWVKSNFILTPAQSTYINSISPLVATYWGSKCALAFLYRRPVILNYPVPPTTPGYTKWTGERSSLSIAVDGGGNLVVKGEVEFTVTFVEN